MCAAVDATVYDVPLSGAPELLIGAPTRQPTSSQWSPERIHPTTYNGTRCLVEGLVTCVRPLCASTAVSVDMWLDSALKDVAHHSATTRDHCLLLDKTAGVVVCAQCGHVRRQRLPAKCPQ
ncbi:hypothetical protein HPB52_012528 [Rhipicephalus sanguineus]|uniref:Uncharacterized protein n=1 Tax=Rhipicephalus sanguineus TaxID=34632 RepID=A0A9D4T9W3_RHISA|nr:hypothetical protein HPB52_012528 [Rhipicephalus sanguineus]